jgi:hypothetical protein
MEPNGNGQVFPFRRPKDRRRRWKRVRWLVAIGIILVVAVVLLSGYVTGIGIGCLIIAGVIATGILD